MWNGLSFPFRKAGDGFPPASQGDSHIWESIQQILLTRRGERVMNPEFGSNLQDIVFENNDDDMAVAMGVFEIKQSLARWEPRINIIDVQGTSDPVTGYVNFVIEYEVAGNRYGNNLPVERSVVI
jgi:hypothetical protein